MTVPMVSSFQQLVLSFAPVFTQPSFGNFAAIVAGWVWCRGRHTVTGAILAAGARAKHFSCYHRFFSRARWCLDAVGHVLLLLALRWVPDDAAVLLGMDDTLCRKTGRHIWGAGMHHDPLRSTSARPFFAFGHSWVVLSIHIALPFLTSRLIAIPIMFRLYRKRKKPRPPGRPKGERKSTGEATDREYRTRPQLAAEMLAIVAGWLNGRRIHVVGDSEYSGKSISRQLPEGMDLFGRMPMDAALYAEPDVSTPGKNGRPRTKGDRLPNPAQLARSRAVKWSKTRVDIYGRSVPVWLKCQRALWYNSAGRRPVLCVVVRDPSRKRRDDCFFTTDMTATPVGVVETYAKRWPLEVAFRDIKQELGLEDPQSWTRRAVERTAPTAMVVYGLTVMWYAWCGHAARERWFVVPAWYRKKSTVSFADMLATLRQASWAGRVLSDPAMKAGSSETSQMRVVHGVTSLSMAS